ncbi:response regulator [Leptolyngbya boryana CZ1]|uniref:Response regulator n=1 Tax=Leptolyngbya boryana CZ1 TaxID=3060204 RepID=A0AA96WP71_LEPBY|nr:MULTISPECIES: response regulator [Leptolyngbya]MBN8564729.1 response regulator [Leptolyngbya sp. UWPOB_LEPTO1]WNZ43352.1 response regulator [Leptolyngbya boryana CZ1]
MDTQLDPGVTVLLVEDTPSDAYLMMRGISQSQMTAQLHWVETGEAALQFLRQRAEIVDKNHPRLVLLDLNLPGMSGQEVLTYIKADSSLKHIPVIIFTTSSDPRDILKAYQLQANCYVIKPIEAQEFIHATQQLLNFWLAIACLPGL